MFKQDHSTQHVKPSDQPNIAVAELGQAQLQLFFNSNLRITVIVNILAISVFFKIEYLHC